MTPSVTIAPAADEVWQWLASALQNPTVHIQPLGGGLTNRNFRVDLDEGTYVLRINGTGSALLGINRDSEVACAQAAHAAGVAPQIVADHAARNALVTRFIQGQQLTDHSAHDPAVLARIARTMRWYHDRPIPEGACTFQPFDVVRDYRCKAAQRGASMPGMDGALALLTLLEERLQPVALSSLCHNDLLAANLFDTGSDLFSVIDWEYAGRGDRFFDLANFAANSCLSEAEERILVEAYFGPPCLEECLGRLRLMRLVSDLRESTWSYLQATIPQEKPSSEYRERGGETLERFLTGAKAMGLPVS